jgi:hypothetical protein
MEEESEEDESLKPVFCIFSAWKEFLVCSSLSREKQKRWRKPLDPIAIVGDPSERDEFARVFDAWYIPTPID